MLENVFMIRITETWADKDVQLPYYTMFRKHRVTERGGGVLLIVYESMKVALCDICDIMSDLGFQESVCCIIDLSKLAKTSRCLLQEG